MSVKKSSEEAPAVISAPIATEVVAAAETTATTKESASATAEKLAPKKLAAEKPCAPDGLNAGDLQLQVSRHKVIHTMYALLISLHAISISHIYHDMKVLRYRAEDLAEQLKNGSLSSLQKHALNKKLKSVKAEIIREERKVKQKSDSKTSSS